MLSYEWIIFYLLLGSFVGFMAGLLGIGGGGILVPVLTAVFLYQGVPIEQVVHLALGTAMASIVFTSFSSMRAHHARGGVLWPVFRFMAPGVIAGTFVGTFLAARMNTLHLSIFFTVFMAYVAAQMFLDKKPKPSRELTGRGGLFAAGGGIGAVSALVSIGGGALTVPYLIWQNIDVKKAIGTSAALGLPISLAGSLGYLINGWSQTSWDKLTLGYVNLPAVLTIAAASFWIAPLGARMAHRLPVAILKKIFACLLVALSLRMLYSVL